MPISIVLRNEIIKQGILEHMPYTPQKGDINNNDRILQKFKA